MKILVIDRFGGPENLEIRDLPVREPGPNEVRVRVRAASINPIDGKIRRGEVRFISGSRFPMKLGGDFAGVVDAVGAQVREFAPGQAVFGVTQGLGGAHAEFVVTDAGDAESGGVLGKVVLENPFAEDPELARAS